MRQDVEASEANAGTEQVHEGDQPAYLQEERILLGRREDQEDHHHRRSDAEGNNIGDRIEFFAEQRFASAEARDASVQGITDHAKQDKPNGMSEMARDDLRIGRVVRLNTAQDG